MKKYNGINAYILGGGKSTRMQQDKAFLKIKGKYFIDIIIEELSNLFENIYLIGKDYHHPLLKQSIPDIIKNKGPIGGIFTALKYSKMDINFFIGLDYPLLDSEIIKLLLTISERVNFQHMVYVPQLDDGLHPLFSVYMKQSFEGVDKCIASGLYQVRCIFNRVKTQYVNLVIKAREYSDNINEEKIKRCFFNLNTPKDYEKLFEIYNL